MSKSQKHTNVKVLMYHRIIKETAGKKDNKYDVSEKDFRRHLSILDLLNFTPITFHDYNLYLKDELTLPKNPVILTFDDGYTDIFEIAYPILKEYNMRAVIFVLGDRNLRHAVWDHKNGDKGSPLMTDEQIFELSSEGYEIGVHTMTHPILPKLNLDRIREEIVTSKEVIETLLGKEALTFSYPYGLQDQKVQSIVSQAGFKFACGVFTGPPVFGANTLDIRRLEINRNTNVLKFLLKILTPYEYFEWLYRKTRYKDTYNTKNYR